jgi:hypothetical protein
MLYRHLDGCCQPHRSRFNNFLNVGRCDYKVVLQMKAYELLSSLNPRKGETCSILDCVSYPICTKAASLVFLSFCFGFALVS